MIPIETARTIQRRLILLAEASRAFTEANFDHDTILGTLGDLVAQYIGDTCVIRLLSEDRKWLKAAAVHHPDPEAQQLARALNMAFGQSAESGPASVVLTTGSGLLVPTVDQEQLRTTVRKEYLEFLDRVGVHSLVMVPLRVRGTVIGTLGVTRDTADRPYTADDQSLLQDMADRAAMAVENARLYNSMRTELAERAQAEARYDLVTRATNDAVWDWNLETDLIWRNESTQTLFGYPPDETGGIDWWYAHIHPDDRDQVVAGVNAAIGDGSQKWFAEYRFSRSDGSYAYILDRGYIIRDESGTPVRMIGAMVDITRRREAEDALRAGERKYRSLVENIPDVTWTSDSDNVLHYISPNVVNVCGRTPDELYHDWQTIRSGYIHPDDRERVRAAYNALFTEGKPYDVEFRIQAADGSWCWLHERAASTYEWNGRRLADGVLSNITERKRTAAALELFRNLIDHSNDAIYVIDPEDGALLDANEKACSSLGYSRDELLRLRVGDIETVSPNRMAWLALVEEVKAKGFVMADREHVRKDRTRTAVEVNVKFISIDGQGYMVAVARDIAERKRAEESLKQAHEMLVLRLEERTTEVFHMMGQIESVRTSQARFVADASHDLRTPLTIVRAELDLLRRRPGHDHSTLVALDRINDESKRIDRLASDMLLLATIDAAHAQQPFVSARLDELLLDAVVEIGGEGISWDVNFTDAIEIDCIPQSIQRALNNVLDNAVKYSPERSSVRVELTLEGASAVVTVADTGSGIAEEDLPKIFDRFYRADRARTTPGTGLGLTIVRAIVELHRGTVELTSEIGVGTTVRLTLPAAG